jgi:hypothetical protein
MAVLVTASSNLTDKPTKRQPTFLRNMFLPSSRLKSRQSKEPSRRVAVCRLLAIGFLLGLVFGLESGRHASSEMLLRCVVIFGTDY